MNSEEDAKVILTNRFENALVYATQLHRGQWRKVVPTPYVGHLLAVSALVLEDGGDEDEAIAALLHDAIEDCGGIAIRNELLGRFGKRVTEIVEGCTEPETQPEESWQDHKLRYLAQIHQGTAAVHRVALADRLHNGRSIVNHLRQRGDRIWRYFRAMPAELLWFYEAQLELFRGVHPGWMVTELAAIVQLLRQYVGESDDRG